MRTALAVLSIGLGLASVGAPAPSWAVAPTGFGSCGVMELDAVGLFGQPSNVSPRSLAAAPGDRTVVLVGSQLHRLDPAGQPDGTFATQGHTNTDGDVVAVQPDGRIVTAGGRGQSGMVVQRFYDTGFGDTTFGPYGGPGTVFVPGTANSSGADLVLAADGKIVAVTTGAAGTYVARLTASGAMDGTFGQGGVTLIPSLTSASSRVTLQADGAALVAGKLAGENGDIGVVRLLPNGTVDDLFGTDGLARWALGAAIPTDVAFDGGGRAVTFGKTGPSATDRFLARLTTAGQPDGTFAAGGVLSPVPGPVTAAAVFPQADSSLLLPGRVALNGGGTAFGVVRILAGGTLDSLFGAATGAAGAPFPQSPDGDGVVARRADGGWLYGEGAIFHGFVVRSDASGRALAADVAPPCARSAAASHDLISLHARTGAQSAPAVVQVTNTGPAPLTFGQVAVAGFSGNQFLIQADGCSFQTFAPNATCTTSVVFAPTTTPPSATHFAYLVFPSNAPGGYQSVRLDGRIDAVLRTPYSVWTQPGVTSIDGIGTWVVPLRDPTATGLQADSRYFAQQVFLFASSPVWGSMGLAERDGVKFAYVNTIDQLGAPNGASVPFPWAAGTIYFQVFRNVSPGVWVAMLLDTTTGNWITIGQLNLPAAWGHLSPVSMTMIGWADPPAQSCGAYPKAEYLLHAPVGFNGPTWTMATHTSTATVAGDCPTQPIVGSTGWVYYGAGA